VTTRRTLSALVLAGALTARSEAQIISVPRPEQTGPPVTLSLSFGFLSSGSRYDGQSGTLWQLGEALVYRATLDFGMRSGALGLTGSLARQPIRRSGGSAPVNSDGDIDLRQFLATFRTREGQGAHQVVEVGLGLAQWANYSGTDVLTADERKPRNALALNIGYGFGFSIGDRASLFVLQDLATLWGSGEGLTAGQSRQVQQYTTRLGARYRFRGSR
jgi:hypothetical protein